MEEMHHGACHRIDMARRAGDRLCQHVARGVEYARRHVAGLARRGAEADPDQGLRLFLDHGDQAIPHDLLMDHEHRVLGMGFISIHGHVLVITMLPSASIRAVKHFVTIVVVSSSTINAGPAIVDPDASSLRLCSAMCSSPPVAGSTTSTWSAGVAG